MSSVDDLARIRSEYESRARSIPADLYSWRKPEIRFWQRRTAAVCAKLLCEAGAWPLTGKAIADIGCGTGNWFRQYLDWGAQAENLHGIDLLEGRITQARRVFPDVDLAVGDACHLPWPDRSMDIVTQFTAFSSMPAEDMRARSAAEILRVLKPNGHVLWYDCRYSNPRRPAVHGIGAKEIRRIFPGCPVRTVNTTLLPPLSRAVARHSPVAAALLERIPFLRTHLAALITNAPGSPSPGAGHCASA